MERAWRQRQLSGSLDRRTLGNLALSAISRLSTMLMQLCVSVVLARSLTPVDYGIVGYAQIFIAFLTLISEFGLNSAAIQQQRIDVHSVL